MIIRDEKIEDRETIGALTKAAFEDCPHGDHTEQFIVSALRDSHALTVSLVAEVDGEVVGHAAFSPVTVSGRSCEWYGLGPVSVLPEFQRKGIGKSLIREGLSRLKALGAQGCMLVGDPGYYGRFGFRNIPELTLEGVPPEYFLALPFGDCSIHGAAVFHEGFNARG